MSKQKCGFSGTSYPAGLSLKPDFPISSKMSLNDPSSNRHSIRYRFTKGSQRLSRRANIFHFTWEDLWSNCMLRINSHECVFECLFPGCDVVNRFDSAGGPVFLQRLWPCTADFRYLAVIRDKKLRHPHTISFTTRLLSAQPSLP